MSSKTENLKRLINIPSVTGPAKDGAPFGEECLRALKYFLELGESFGFKTYNADGYAGHIEYGEGDVTVGVLAHLDVVPAAKGWDSDPFMAEERDGKIYGRGATDDKGPAIAALYALKKIKADCEKTGKPLGARVRLIVGCNEENGSACISYYKSKIEMPDIAFSPDADFPLINCEMGLMGYEITLPYDSFLSRNLISIKGGSAHNAVPDSAECILKKGIDISASEKLGINGITAEKTADGAHIAAEGRAAHSMEAGKGDNAVFKLVAALRALNNGAEDTKTLDWINTYLCDGVCGEALGIDFSDEISGRITVNLVYIFNEGNEIKLTLDMRVPITVNCKDITKKIEEKLNGYGRVKLLRYNPHLYMPKDCFLVQTLLNVYKEYTGEENAECLTTGGGTYARTMPNCVAFGATFPGKHYNIHGGNEYIEIETLGRLEEIFAKAITALCGYKKQGK